MLRPNKKLILKLSLIILICFSWVFSLRFILVDRPHTHYHANFAIAIDGVFDPLDNFSFYEEVASCSADYNNDPKARVHLHNSESSVVHVHDNAATWGHLIANLGYGLTDHAFENQLGVFVFGDNNRAIRYMLNGKVVESVANRTIGNEDVLLIDISSSGSEEILERYGQIPKNAGEYNTKVDPSSCQGSADEGISDRLLRTLGI